MSNVYFISDLHLAHKNVITFHDNFRGKCMGVSTIEEHDEMIFDLWNDKATKRDTIYVLGDIGYDIDRMKALPGRKILQLGNHDKSPASRYLEVFDDIIGPIKHKRHWLAHFPPIEQELWGKDVIHGHTHSTGVEDKRYINVSVEMTRGHLISYQDIKSGKFTTWDKVNKTYEDVEWD